MRFRSVKAGGWSYTNPMPPILGKIRLGIRDAKKGFPRDMDYFIIDSLPPDLKDRIADKYGEKPKFLHVAFPYDELEAWFPWSFVMYYAPKEQEQLLSPRWIKCQGDGEEAVYDASIKGGKPGEEIESTCAGESCKFYLQKLCRLQGFVFIMMPQISPGLFQIDTTSQHTRNALINEVYGKGGIKEMFNGRMNNLIDRSGEPLLLLERRPQKTRQGISTTHFPLHVRVRPDLREVLAGPVELIAPTKDNALPEPMLPVDNGNGTKLITTTSTKKDVEAPESLSAEQSPADAGASAGRKSVVELPVEIAIPKGPQPEPLSEEEKSDFAAELQADLEALSPAEPARGENRGGPPIPSAAELSEVDHEALKPELPASGRDAESQEVEAPGLMTKEELETLPPEPDKTNEELRKEEKDDEPFIPF